MLHGYFIESIIAPIRIFKILFINIGITNKFSLRKFIKFI